MFISTYVIDNYGLRACITTGSVLMIIGSTIRCGATYTGSFWPVFYGHILSQTGQAFLRNPVTKLTNNWFGERERGFATGICIMAGPVGILVCKVLIQTIMWNEDKLPQNSHQGRLHYEFFLIANTLVITLMCLPSIFLV